MDATVLSNPQLRILVVDDEPEIVDLLVRYLTQAGAQVSEARSAEQAKRLIANDPQICVVISDISMPGQDGLLLTEELLTGRDDSRAIEVIIMTGFATTEAAISAMRARAFDLVRKPLRLSELTSVVARAVTSSLARRARAAREAEIREDMRAALEERQRLGEQLSATQAGLQSTRSALEHSERARSGILSVVSHELRTPLIPVLGFSEFIATTPDLPAEDIRDYAMTIHRAGSDMLKLIEVALDVVALQDGGGLGPRTGEWVANIAGRLHGRLRPMADQRGVVLAMDGPADVPVYGDMERLERAVFQLLDNAIKASSQGGIVEMRWMLQPGPRTRIELLDRGPGMPADVMRSLGSAFLKHDVSAERSWPGAGLGLALACRVAAAHGGELTVEGREGGGSRVALTIPHHGAG